MTILLIFAGMTLLSFAAIAVFMRPTSSQKVAKQRLIEISHSQVAIAGQSSAEDLVTVPHQSESGKLEQMFHRYRFARRLSTSIAHAGKTYSVTSLISMSVGLAFAGGIVAHLFVSALPLEAATVLVGGALPYAKLRFQRSRRMKALNDALPATIDLMARALRAGHSMSSAIEVIAEQSAEPLASEFQQVAQQQKLGMPFRDAVLQLTDRIPSKDLHFVVTAILVQKETGGDLTEILDRTVEIIRERLRIEGEIKTYTAQGRLTGWILSGLPIVMLIVINMVNPGYSQVLFQDPLGQKLLYAAGTLIIIGGLTIRAIVTIEV
jgi:tight adherence protein B